jgi:hypothetical protein
MKRHVEACWLKLKALAQWFVALELKQHRHWCVNESNQKVREAQRKNCVKPDGTCWYCTGVFCADESQKDCPNCEKFKRTRVEVIVGVSEERRLKAS